MSFTKRITVAVAALAVAAAPAAMASKPDNPGAKGQEKSAQAKGKGKGKAKGKNKAKPRTVVLKGTVASFDAATGSLVVDVTNSNKHGRSYVESGTATVSVTPDTRLRVADVNGDGAVDLNDFAAGDKVVVQTKKVVVSDDAALEARKVVNQTQPEADEDDSETPTEAPAAE